MVSIYIRAEGNAAKAHLAKPIELSVEREVLQYAEYGHQESETHSEPDKAAPVVDRPECLAGQKNDKDVGEEKLELHARVVGRGRAMKSPLAKDEKRKSKKRQKQRRNNELKFPRVIGAHRPDEKEQARADFQYGARPFFDGAV